MFTDLGSTITSLVAGLTALLGVCATAPLSYIIGLSLIGTLSGILMKIVKGRKR